jgi:nuclear GTP-binding protein
MLIDPVISQDALESFRGAVAAQAADPTTYLMKRNKLPMSLINEPGQIPGMKQHAAKIAVGSQPFSETFGPKAQRKRPKLDFSSIEDLAGRTGTMQDAYVERLEQQQLLSGTSGDAENNEATGELTSAREFIFMKGTSKRIWNELYKVIDSSDVILHVLDARDPDGTRCRSVEKYIRTEAPHKHLVFVLNKVDLVPSKVAVSPIPAPTHLFPYQNNPIFKSRTYSSPMNWFCYKMGRAKVSRWPAIVLIEGRLAPSWGRSIESRVICLS